MAARTRSIRAATGASIAARGAAQGAVGDRPREHWPPVVLELLRPEDVRRAERDRTSVQRDTAGQPGDVVKVFLS
jgi:hypothetical protein